MFGSSVKKLRRKTLASESRAQKNKLSFHGRVCVQHSGETQELGRREERPPDHEPSLKPQQV